MKSMGKLTMLMIAVVAIGTFALPSVYSTQTYGQHKFNAGSAVNCDKCHDEAGSTATEGGVKYELGASGNTDYNLAADGGTLSSAEKAKLAVGTYVDGVKIHGDLTCDECHTKTNKITAVSREILTDDHTGVLRTPNCITCHIHVTNDAAKELGATTTDFHKDLGTGVGNKGCIGCHTAVQVTGTVKYGDSSDTKSLTVGSTTLTITAGTP